MMLKLYVFRKNRCSLPVALLGKKKPKITHSTMMELMSSWTLPSSQVTALQ